jgi:anti-sigma B factor antagonist
MFVMDLRIDTIQGGRETTMYAEGRIVLGEASNFLHDSFRELIDQGHTRITLNLRGVSYIDSGGLGELVGCFTAVTRRGGRLRLAAPNERVSRLLSLTRINEVMEIMEAEARTTRERPGSGSRKCAPGIPMARTTHYPQAAAR